MAAMARVGTILTLGALLLVALSATLAEGYEWAPVLYVFTKNDASADKERSRLTCSESGGTLIADASSLMHETVMDMVTRDGRRAPWYAYIGSDTYTDTISQCREPFTPGGNYLATPQCYWRWKEGRWQTLPETPGLYFGDVNNGVTHFLGNYFKQDEPDWVRIVGGFPSYFETNPNTTVGGKRDCRPNGLLGRDMIAWGRTDTHWVWSDNLPSGGFAYENYTYADKAVFQAFDPDAPATTKRYFFVLCNVQAPSRTALEVVNTSSDLQKWWWVIFFVIFLVINLVIFIVVVACQEREDMDEPPEDPPEWVDGQQPQQLKSYRSQRTLRQYDDEEGVGQEGGGEWDEDGVEKDMQNDDDVADYSPRSVTEGEEMDSVYSPTGDQASQNPLLTPQQQQPPSPGQGFASQRHGGESRGSVTFY